MGNMIFIGWKECWLKQNKLSCFLLFMPLLNIYFMDFLKAIFFGILIKYKSEDNLLTVLRNLIDHYKSNSKIRIEVDFNPNNI